MEVRTWRRHPRGFGVEARDLVVSRRAHELELDALEFDAGALHLLGVVRHHECRALL